jgi:hypothetical protein
MMLGDPEAPVAPSLSVAGQVAGIIERLARRAIFADANKVEDGQLGHGSISSRSI